MVLVLWMGDVVIFGGELRNCYYGVSRVFELNECGFEFFDVFGVDVWDEEFVEYIFYMCINISIRMID